jgi:hypothetical protein
MHELQFVKISMDHRISVYGQLEHSVKGIILW